MSCAFMEIRYIDYNPKGLSLCRDPPASWDLFHRYSISRIRFTELWIRSRFNRMELNLTQCSSGKFFNTHIDYREIVELFNANVPRRAVRKLFLFYPIPYTENNCVVLDFLFGSPAFFRNSLKNFFSSYLHISISTHYSPKMKIVAIYYIIRRRQLHRSYVALDFLSGTPVSFETR